MVDALDGSPVAGADSCLSGDFSNLKASDSGRFDGGRGRAPSRAVGLVVRVLAVSGVGRAADGSGRVEGGMST